MTLPKVGGDYPAVLRSAMDEDGQQDLPLWAVVDGGYTNRIFLKHLPPPKWRQRTGLRAST